MKRDIPPKSESVVDMVRVATYINTIPAKLLRWLTTVQIWDMRLQ